MEWGKRYLMCSPDHYTVSYSINPWMDRAVRVDPYLACAQWEGVVSTLEQAGAQVERLPGRPGLPDQVFTANAGIVDGDVFVPARMRHPERQEEPAYAAAWFAARGSRILELETASGEEVVQEGSGDALPFAGVLVAGWRTRSSLAAYPALARVLPVPTLTLDLVDPRYYHVDLTFCPLDDRRALVFPDAWDAAGAARMRDLIPEPLVLDATEAATFCANSVVVGSTVVMPACPPRVGRQLEAWGFDVATVGVGEFLKAGGAVRCMTLALDVNLTSRVTGSDRPRWTAARSPPADTPRRAPRPRDLAVRVCCARAHLLSPDVSGRAQRSGLAAVRTLGAPLSSRPAAWMMSRFSRRAARGPRVGRRGGDPARAAGVIAAADVRSFGP